MTELASAVLVPFDEQGKNPVDSEKTILDFNPETLNIKITNTLEQEQAQKNKPRRQFVASTSSTLSFDAIFDSTHPSKQPGHAPSSETPEMLDVRKRTERLAKLLYVDDKAKKPAPRRVRFSWGSIVFEGVMDSYAEVLDYFSPEGVPLRSKVSISIKEQKFEYKIEGQRAALAGFNNAAPGAPPGVGPGTVPGADADGPLGLGAPGAFGAGLSFGLDASFGLSADVGLSLGFGVDAAVGLDLGVGVDLGFSAGASFGMSMDAAVEVFGGAAVSAAVGASGGAAGVAAGSAPAGPPAGAAAVAAAGGGIDLGKSTRGGARAEAGPIAKGNQAPWAPAGPTPGSRAAALAAIVHEQRASASPPDRTPPGGSFTATHIEPKAAATPLPVRGSPPRLPPAVGSQGSGVVFGKARSQPVERANLAGDRPHWEALDAVKGTASAAKGACCPACKKSTGSRGATAPCGTCGGKRS